ncbi:hypothetical protein CPB84DRAFT_1852982 [Gymnopilus junonius]|uniref:Uncharacterized protein n=1 Tax=Gymnopilus junonius TaxID=109634 RepID=A0A9P5NBU1_GYMJU|nr:hypothetical protein CPB84DRAFT_1852982 [Gymnopilus junonius]
MSQHTAYYAKPLTTEMVVECLRILEFPIFLLLRTFDHIRILSSIPTSSISGNIIAGRLWASMFCLNAKIHSIRIVSMSSISDSPPTTPSDCLHMKPHHICTGLPLKIIHHTLRHRFYWTATLNRPRELKSGLEEELPLLESCVIADVTDEPGRETEDDGRDVEDVKVLTIYMVALSVKGYAEKWKLLMKSVPVIRGVDGTALAEGFRDAIITLGGVFEDSSALAVAFSERSRKGIERSKYLDTTTALTEDYQFQWLV